MSKQTEWESKFEEQWKAATLRAATLCGAQSAPTLAAIAKAGALAAARETLRRGEESLLFEPLLQAGHLELSMEALVTRSDFADLFSDREVNLCLERLCEAGFFG